MKKLAIITTHPIQYNAPWFKLLAQRGRVRVKVFYTWSQVEHEQKYDPGFGKNIEWDIPLLDGYDYTFVKNTSKRPGSKSYGGIQNPTLIKEAELWEPDAVLIFGWNFNSHLKAMRHFHGKVPVLFRGDSNNIVKPGGLKSLLKPLVLRFVFKHIDYALYVGKANKLYYETAGVTGARLYFAPHAVDNKRFTTDDATISSAIQWRNDLGIGEETLVFLFAGKFGNIKNPLLLLEAASRIGDHSAGDVTTNKKAVHFVFVGNGELEEEMKKRKSDRVHFIDFQNQDKMPSVYQLADVFVLPSVSETWGLSVNEAMAAGKLVLVSDTCGCAPDLVQHDINGLLFESGNVNDLAAKLSLLAAKSKDDLHKMGQTSRKIIEDWSFEKIAEAVEDLMARIKTS